MNRWIKFFCLVLPIVLIIISLLATYFIFTNKAFQIGVTSLIDPNLGASLGNLYGGVIGTLLSASSIFLLIYTIINQKDEAQKNNLKSNFFKMIDYHGNPP